jgi:predicted Zn finger-like uncharacterized protein
MLIVCPSCATSYNLTPGSLGANGRSVRCARCEGVWHADVPREVKLLAAVEALGPEPEPAWEPPAPEAAEAENVTLYVENAPSAPPEPDEWRWQPGERAPLPEEALAPSGQNLPQDLQEETEAPPIVPADFDPIDASSILGDPKNPALDGAAILDVESLATPRARRSGRRREPKRWNLRWRPSRLQCAILALVILDFMLVGLRSDMVRFFPQTASFYSMIGLPVNLRGLVFNDIVTTSEQHEGVPVLVVEGNIVNVARKPVEVPRLKLAVRNAAGNEIYSWTMVPSRTVLPTGETVAFRSRLASPPPEGRDVLVRFFTRRDVVAGIR